MDTSARWTDSRVSACNMLSDVTPQSPMIRAAKPMAEIRQTRPISWVKAALKDFRRVPDEAHAGCLTDLTIAPSGDPTPSVEDRTLTKRLREAGEVLGIRLLDHLILGDDSLYSFGDEGWPP